MHSECYMMSDQQWFFNSKFSHTKISLITKLGFSIPGKTLLLMLHLDSFLSGSSVIKHSLYCVWYVSKNLANNSPSKNKQNHNYDGVYQITIMITLTEKTSKLNNVFHYFTKTSPIVAKIPCCKLYSQLSLWVFGNEIKHSLLCLINI